MSNTAADGSCSATYVTICCYHEELNADEMGAFIGLEPTRVVEKNSRRIKNNGWFFSTEGRLQSTVLADHLKFIAMDIYPYRDNLRALIGRGVTARLYCFWVSAAGNGGPVIDSDTLRLLNDIGLDLHFDIWFDVGE